MQEKQLVIGAGGTGGHMFPAQALAREMRARGWSVALITDERGHRLASDFPADPIEVVPAATLSLRRPHRLPAGLWTLRQGVEQAKALMRQLSPHVVMGFGGYPAFPALAAAPEEAKIILHEQNAVLGRVNRLFARRARAIASGFYRLDGLPRGTAERWTVTGNPVRDDFLRAREQPVTLLDPQGDICLLVLGGSQGARVFSELVPAAARLLPSRLRERLVVVQQARAETLDAVRSAYDDAGVRAECEPFFSDVHERLANAHLVLSRAGASSLSEISVVGRPSVLVPLPGAMDNHQTHNAEALVKSGSADLVAERGLTAEKLARLLEERLSDRHDLFDRANAARAIGRAEATRALGDLVERVARSRRG